MDANNINTGVSQKNDEFNWFKPTSGVHFEGVKTSAPDFTIPPTPASSYSNLHVVLDHVHPSSETITRSVLPANTHFTGVYAGPTSRSLTSSMPREIDSTPIPSAPAFTSGPSTLYNNKLDSVPSDTFRAVPEAVNPELPGARSQDALTSLKSEIAPIQPPFVPLEEIEDSNDLAERKDRGLPEAVDLSLTDESQKWADEWNKVGKDVRDKKFNLHHYQPERDSFWAKQWNTVGNDIKNKKWNVKRTGTLPTSFKLNSWAMIDQLEDAERRSRQVRGINGLWSGRMNRVHHELLNTVAPIGWVQWFDGLKNRLANQSSQLVNSAADATKGAANRAVDTAVADYDYAKDSAKKLTRTLSDSVTDATDAAKDIAHRATDTAAANYEYVKDAAMDLANRAADTAAVDYDYAKDVAKDAAKKLTRTLSDSATVAADAAMDLAGAAKNLADSATNAIVEKVHDLTTTPMPKYNGTLWSEYEFYMPQLSRKVPAEIIAMEEKERAERMSRGINPVVSGMWHRLGREMLHTYRDDIAELFAGLRLQLANKGSVLIESAKDAYSTFNIEKAPKSLLVQAPGVPMTFDWSRRVPADIVAMEETERADRMSRGINPIVSGKWYRLGLELKHKFSLRPTIASTASLVAEAATDLAGKAYEKMSDISEVMIKTKDDLLATAPVTDFAEHGQGAHLNLFAYTAEPVDFTFKSRRAPADIIAMEEKERAVRMAEGVDVLAYSKWNSLLSQPHKTLIDAPSMAATVLPTLSAAKDTLVESGKGISGFLGSWASSMASTASSYIDAAKHSHIAEVAMEYVHPTDAASISSIAKAEEAERARRMKEKVDPMYAARMGRVQEELLGSIKSV